jgi:hypothetical protein
MNKFDVISGENGTYDRNDGTTSSATTLDGEVDTISIWIELRKYENEISRKCTLSAVNHKSILPNAR